MAKVGITRLPPPAIVLLITLARRFFDVYIAAVVFPRSIRRFDNHIVCSLKNDGSRTIGRSHWPISPEKINLLMPLPVRTSISIIAEPRICPASWNFTWGMVVDLYRFAIPDRLNKGQSPPHVFFGKQWHRGVFAASTFFSVPFLFIFGVFGLYSSGVFQNQF